MAEAADLERKAGFVRSPLHGLPIAIKDLFHIKGRQTTAGSKSWLGRISTETALCVERLLDAGMIPLGKTHLVEFAYGTWGTNKPMGTPWNPWDMNVHRVAGGSSSGSAVAVAAGMAPAALGTDTGGSVRIPAALCGLVGVEADLRTHSAGRRRAVVADARFGRSDHADGGRCGDARCGDGRRADSSARSGAIARGHAHHCAFARAVSRLHRAARSSRRVRRSDRAASRARRARRASSAFRSTSRRWARRTAGSSASKGYAQHRAMIDDESADVDPGVRARMLIGKARSCTEYIDALAERGARSQQFARVDAWTRRAADADAADHGAGR